MPGMSDIILRAPVFKRIGDATRVPGAQNSSFIANVIDDLKDKTKSLIDIGISAGMYTDKKQAEHLDKDWLESDPINHPGFWNGSGYDVPGLVREGILTALTLFQKTGKPLDLFWAISGLTKKDKWNVAVAECTEHIVVIFFTPNVPCMVDMVDDYSITITEQRADKTVGTRHSKKPVG
jgi:hypothetical protein